MATGILIAVTVVLVAAACYVGLLLLRRSRPAAEVERPRTVGELVRRRAEPADDDLSGTDLFTPKDPQTVSAAPPPDEPGLPGATGVAVPHPAPRQAVTPPGGVEVGDAPWRRAARMMGSEPGAAWETAPIPVVPAAESGQDAAAATDQTDAGRTAVMTVPAPTRVAPDEAGATAVMAVPAPTRREPDEAGETAVITVPEQADAPSVDGPPAGSHRVDVAPEIPPVVEPQVAVAADPADAEVAEPEIAAAAPVSTAVWTPPEEVAARSTTPAAEPAPAPADAPDAPSRPLSDPDLTPLMGIPVVRPLADTPTPVPAVADPGPALVTPRLSRPSVIDDEIVSLLPSTMAAPPRVAVTGSPQPVWFRVVRRDGDPVGGVLVTLLDDHGQEADATKTATDGGGELRAPHGGWFLMIASADGFQPRAVTLAVDEKPVEIALLLPRSATVTGAVREGGAPAGGMRVVAFQEGEVVDELVTDRDGGYRFDDLAEGVYALSASGARGSAVGRVTLSEGADVQLDLDLRRP